MALTILERPEGHILDSTENTATVSESYGAGDAQFVSPTVHGLVDGDYIYSVPDIEDYAGFFYVDATTTGIFKLRPYPTGDYVQFINNGSITWFKSNLTHGWSAVHLPITYRISNNLYPVNTFDTSRTITSVTDSNGWSVIHLSGSMGTLHTYDFINITVPNDTQLSGVYQIVEWISSTVMIINLAYDSGNNFTSASAIKYYGNYNVLVRVYAGINASHKWTLQKPYEMAATLKLIPDSNNEVFFSINEILKSYIETRNNLQLGTLPNNIDFWTQFYIEIAEAYDDSDGYVFGTTTSSFTSDQANFEGVGVNAKLAFKNIYSGYLSQYIMINNTGKFLTLFIIPVIFACSNDAPDCYSDVSFLNPYDDTALTLRKEFYSGGSLITTVDTDLGTPDSGVIRAELEADCNYDRVDITLLAQQNIQGLSEFVNFDTGGPAWSLGATPSASAGSGLTTDNLEGNIVELEGIYTYTVNYTFTRSGSFNSGDIRLLDASGNTLGTSGQFPFNTGSGSVEITSDESAPITKIALRYTAVGGTSNVTVNALSVDSSVISETKEFKIDCGCSNQEIRLTWLNNLGGFDYWNFTAKKDHIVEITEALQTKKNILPTWPKSYGANADTIKKQTLRVSNKAYTVRSQLVTDDQIDALAYIKSSVLVQIVNSRTDRRTVIVDTDSFFIRKDGDDTHEIAFNISFTDDIPAQTT